MEITLAVRHINRPQAVAPIAYILTTELSLLRLAPRAATVSAIHRPPGSNLPGLKVAGLDAQAFTRLLGPLREIMERNAGTYGSYSSAHHGFGH